MVMKSPEESADQNKSLVPWHRENRRLDVTVFHSLHFTGAASQTGT